MFTLLAVFIITMLAVFKLRYWSDEMQTAGIAVIGVYVLWLLVELKVALRDSNRGSKEMDRGTYHFYAVGRALTVLTALIFPTHWSEFGSWVYWGMFLLITGIGLRLFAIKVLGQFYSHWVRISEAQRIISDGPYHFVRHPSYSGMLLAHTGFVLFFFNWISLACLIGAFIPAVIYRIIVEEKALLMLNGYANYCHNRKRVIPFIW